MRIIWHGHSCFEIRDGAVVVTDPHDGKSIGIKQPLIKADLVLVSHEHFDHNCTRIVKGDFHIVREPGDRVERNVTIRCVTAFHDNEMGAKRGKMNLFIFTMGGTRFCHLGDLGHMLSDEEVGRIGPVDVLFVPVGGVFTIDAVMAHDLIAKIRPRVAIPMHFRIGGLSLSIQTVDSFIKMVPEEKVIRVGNEVELSRMELPESTEYWIFSL
ncbi:MAG TPA: MBL fold metallo-hydrolase [Methanomassiliicoccales archaeon]|nr:MBL fold metallo-hydrolase [Methanomassiliicoccales archaeon]